MTPLIDSRTLGLGGGDGTEDKKDADFGLMAIGDKTEPVRRGIFSLSHRMSAEKEDELLM